jgi:hypothetical protein
MLRIDVPFTGPYKIYDIHELEQEIWRNPGTVITVYRILELFGRVYMKAPANRLASYLTIKTYSGSAVCLCRSVETK